jgi:hypothetical protein
MESIRVNVSAFVLNKETQSLLNDLWSEMIEDGFDITYYSEEGDVI